MKNGLNTKDILSKYWPMFACIHFVLCCFLSAGFFKEDPLYGTMGSVDMAPEITDWTLKIISLILTKTLAFFLVLGFWYLICCVVQKKFRRKILVAFVLTSCLMNLYILYAYPGLYYIETDNLIVFSYAIRHLPYYWHGALTSAVYGAAYTVLPHVIAVPLLQCNLFLGVVFWFYEQMNEICNRRWTKWLFLLLVLPESYYVMLHPYRNCMYTVLSIWGIAYVLVAFHKKNIKMQWYIPILFAIIAVWRTEGILIGVGMFIVLEVLSYSNWRRCIAMAALFAICVMSLNKVQNIGSEKYYGKDYLFVSMVGPLSVILNQPDANLYYDGVGEDLQAVNDVVPIEWIQFAGASGYRGYNHSMGRDINQSCATPEEQSAFVLAYIRIVGHNLDTFLACQLDATLSANGTEYPFELASYQGDPIAIEGDIFERVKSMWQIGVLEFEVSSNRSVAYSNPTEDELRVLYEDIWDMTKLSVALRFVIVAYMVYMVIAFFVSFCKMKKINDVLMTFVPLLLLGQLAIIILFMPEGRPAYFYPVYFQSLLVMMYHLMQKSNKSE